MKSMLLKIRLLIVLCLLPGSFLFAQQILDLEKALGIAMQNSPDIRTSLLSLERAQQNLNAQKASLKSRFSLTVDPFTFSRNRSLDDFTSQWYTSESYGSSGTFMVSQPILWTDGTISLVNRFGWQYNKSTVGAGAAQENRSFSNNLYLSLTQPLFTYNSTQLNLKSLELSLENTNLSYAMQKLNIEKQVTQYFYNVYMSQMSLEIAQAEYENTSTNYEITQNKVEAGLSAREELYQSELDFATAESSVEDAKVSLENAKDIFKQLIGMDIYEEITVIADPEAQEVAVDLDNAINYGLNSRMEIRQREIEIENSQFSLIQTKGNNEFKGDLSLSVGIIGNDESFGNVYDNPTKNPSVSLSFNVPIWDWGARESQIKAAEATIASNEINLEQEKIQIVLDIRSTYRSLQNQLRQIAIAQKSEENAQLTYVLNQERYNNGDLTGMDLSLYQTQLSSAKKSYAQALIDYKIELLNLKVQTLYDFEKKEALVLDIIQ